MATTATFLVYTHDDREVFRSSTLSECAAFMGLDLADVLWAWENEGQVDTEEYYLAIDGSDDPNL